MVFIGIDIAKFKHAAAAVDSEGTWLFEGLEFANDAEGFERLLETLQQAGALPEHSKVCLEATGHYGLNLIARLQETGYEVYEINPLLTSSWRRTQSLRKAKNDEIDAKALATWLSSGNPAQLKGPVAQRDDLQALSRFRASQVQIIGDAKRRAMTIIDRVFPEYQGFFADCFGKASLAVLDRWPSAEDLAHARSDAIENAMVKAAGSRFCREDALALKALAKSSVGRSSAALELELRMIVAQIRFNQEQLKVVDGRLGEMMKDSLITTIPGIGVVCGAMILGEIGDISRFASSSKLVAFAGCDPSVFSSGEFEAASGRLSKRGSRYLRQYLWLAADRARMFDPVLGAHYAKKRQEGKCHKVAVSGVVRKLCAIIFSVLTTGRPYACPQS